jgi:hypothetical protein
MAQGTWHGQIHRCLGSPHTDRTFDDRPCFAVAYLSGEDLLTVHVWAGYIVGAVVLIRVIWGFVGPSRARFTDFVYAPRAVLVYVGNLIRSRAARYIGHSPRVERWSSLWW